MTDHLSGYAIIIAFVSVGIAGFTLVLNLIQSKTQRLASESQFISDIQKEFDKSSNNVFFAKTKTEFLASVWQFLNTADRLCFFETKNRLHDNIIEFYTNYLQISLKYYNWIVEIKHMNEEEILLSFPYIKKTCDKFSIIPTDKIRMDILSNYDKLPLN